MKRDKLVFILIAILISLINPVTFAAALILISVYYCWSEGSTGAVKALIIITLRCILNSGFAVSHGSISMIKWCLLFGLSFFAILAKKGQNRNLTQFFLLLGLYFAFLVGTAFLVSSYPLVSTFKAISWAFVFCAVVYAISGDDETDWIDLLRLLLSGIIILSLFALPLDIGYQRNGKGFQGILNHPNMFGIMCALCFSLNLTSAKKLSVGRLALLMLCLVCSFLSQSRTSMFSIVILLVYALFNSEMNVSEKILSVLGLTVLVGMITTIYILNDPEQTGSISAFIFKEHTDNILYSRESQTEIMLDRFTSGPIIGTGFMTPYDPGVRSFAFAFDLNVEPGNLIMTLLAHTGIIGFVLFIVLFAYLFRNTPREKRILFLMPMILSLGEMAFFSSNSIAILYYVIYGTCFRPGIRPEKNRSVLQP